MITEEFFNKYHSRKDGKFVSGGHAVTGPALPLRNSVTGRINPTQVRAAFKTGNVKRNANRSVSEMNSRTTVGKTTTKAKTYAGRVIRESAKGGAPARYTKMGPAVRKFVGEHTGPARRAKEVSKADQDRLKRKSDAMKLWLGP